MTDQNSQFFAILTAVGEAKQANANALGVPWTFSQMGVGDANGADPTPLRDQTKLINERRRAPLNQIKVDPANASIIIAEQVIPPDVGGWWIREIGLYDAAGDLVAVANCAPTFKPLLTQGTGKTQVVRLNIVVTSTANVELKIDPAVVLATRSYVDASILAVLPPNKAAGTFTQVRIDTRGVVQQGFNPTTLAGFGILDAYTQTQTNSAIQNAVNALVNGAGASLDTLKELAAALGNDANFATTVTTALAGKAAKATTLGGYGIADASTTVQMNAAIQSAIAALVGGAPASLDTLAELAAAIGNDANFAATMSVALSGKAAKATTLAGYGITDAMAKNAGGLMIEIPVVSGYLSDLSGTQFISLGNGATEDKPAAISYGAGVHMKYPGGKYAIEFVGGITNEWYGVRRVASDGTGSWRELWHDGNFNPAAKASLAGAVFTGSVRVPDVTAGNSSDLAANTKFVTDAVAKLVASSPAALDTLRELATALGDDPNFATTMTNALAGKMSKGAGGLMTTAPVVAGAIADLAETQFISATNGTTTDKPGSISYGAGFHIQYPNNLGDKYAFEMLAGMTSEWFGVRRIGPAATPWRELYHDGNFNPALKANLAAPTFTGAVSVPDVTAGTSNAQAANTRYVDSALASRAASAWVNFDGVTMAIKGSHNVSSVTDNGVGMWTVNLLSPLANANYAAEVAAPAGDGNWRGFIRGTTAGAAATKSTSALSVGYGGGATFSDSPDMSVVIFGGK